jgi:Ca2+-binding EF-hand superfamily protein
MVRWLTVLCVFSNLIIPAFSEESRTEEVEDDFNVFDLNSDKFIDAQEVIIGYRGDLSRLHVMEFFRDVDKNNDGLVSFAEYQDFALDL